MNFLYLSLSPYEFTDTIATSGRLLFRPLLYCHACRRMERACLAVGSGDVDAYRRRADLVAGHLDLLGNEAEGMFWAADQNCRQADIWGSAFLGPASRSGKRTSLENRVTIGTNKKRPAIVFLVAGQSNAGGCGVISPEAHEARGGHIERPLVPGSTAKEAGLSTNPDDYTHSYIWVPNHGFERIDPNRNAKPDKPDTPGHGMELPVLRELEKRFPENDIFVVKYGPGATNLYEQWNPARQDCERPCYATWLGYYRQAMPLLAGAYPEVRVVGLYWDQGESDGIDNKADEYAENLAEFIATVRRDTGLLELPFFIRKHIFTWANIDTVIAGQAEVGANDPLCHILDIDLGDRQKNYGAWAYSPDNGHLSSKGFVELNRKLFDGPLREAAIDSFGVWSKEDG